MKLKTAVFQTPVKLGGGRNYKVVSAENKNTKDIGIDFYESMRLVTMSGFFMDRRRGKKTPWTVMVPMENVVYMEPAPKKAK